MNPYEGDTLIIIDIQAKNKAEILQCVQESFAYMPGWMFVHLRVARKPTLFRGWVVDINNYQ